MNCYIMRIMLSLSGVTVCYVETHSVTFPGDCHRDVIFKSTSRIEKVYCYKLPYYEVKFTYEEKEYTASCFGCGDINIKCEVPIAENYATDIDVEAKEMAREAEKKSKRAWMICYGVF